MVKKFDETVVIKELPNEIKSYEFIDDISRKLNISKFIPISIKDKSVILYGAGNLGKMAKKYLDKLKIPVSFIIDSNPDKCTIDPFWNNVKIMKLDEVPLYARLEYTTLICIVTTPFLKLYNELRSFEYKNIIPFYDITLSHQHKHPLNNGWYIDSLNEEDIENIKHFLSMLEDDISRAYYIQFIAWHSLREEWIFKDLQISNNNRYFISEILNILKDNETFVDIGSHHGEVTIKFMDVVKNKFKKIYCIEPDDENIEILLKKLEINKNLHNIEICPFVISNKNEVRKFFYGLDYLSQLTDFDELDDIKYVKTYKIDDLNIKPSFMKIHTEGNECNIIKGGINTIKQHRPIIVVTSYHNVNGLWKLPILLLNSLENYIYYFRLHSWCGTGSVIYAIPKERL